MLCGVDESSLAKPITFCLPRGAEMASTMIDLNDWPGPGGISPSPAESQQADLSLDRPKVIPETVVDDFG